MNKLDRIMRNYVRVLAILIGVAVATVGIVSQVHAAQTVEFYISPTTTSAEVGENISLQIRIDTKGQPVDGVQLEYDVDPSLVEFVAINNSNSAFGLSLVSGYENGTFNIARGEYDEPVNGDALITTIVFKATQAGSSIPISSNIAESFAAYQGSDFLNSMRNAVVSVASAPAPAPTPDPEPDNPPSEPTNPTSPTSPPTNSGSSGSTTNNSSPTTSNQGGEQSSGGSSSSNQNTTTTGGSQNSPLNKSSPSALSGDTTAPQVVTATIGYIDGELVATVETDEPSTVSIEYGLAQEDILPFNANSGSLKTEHTIVIDEATIEEEVQYKYRVLAYDEAGNEGQSEVTNLLLSGGEVLETKPTFNYTPFIYAGAGLVAIPVIFKLGQSIFFSLRRRVRNIGNRKVQTNLNENEGPLPSSVQQRLNNAGIEASSSSPHNAGQVVVPGSSQQAQQQAPTPPAHSQVPPQQNVQQQAPQQAPPQPQNPPAPQNVQSQNQQPPQSQQPQYVTPTNPTPQNQVNNQQNSNIVYPENTNSS